MECKLKSSSKSLLGTASTLIHSEHTLGSMIDNSMLLCMMHNQYCNSYKILPLKVKTQHSKLCMKSHSSQYSCYIQMNIVCIGLCPDNIHHRMQYTMLYLLLCIECTHHYTESKNLSSHNTRQYKKCKGLH